jgi:6-phosphogluconate dehydrogenase
MSKKLSDIGVVGLGVMGSALARNFESKGWKTSVYNRSPEKVDKFKKNFVSVQSGFEAHKQLKRFVKSLAKPRKIVLMIKSGKPVDDFINTLSPLLDVGDVIIDGGNSYYKDTEKRALKLEAKKLLFLGMGVSGGEKGALEGPSMMPGGSLEGWSICKEILESVAAKDFEGKPCASYMGEAGAGHLVKMVHNGIEYGIMQMISEVYQILRSGYQLDPVVIGEMFKRFNQGKLESYLIEICEPILKEIDSETGKPLIDIILDKAGQKGTGRWTARDALEYGVETSMISQAVHARVASAFKKKRVRLAGKYNFADKKTKPELSLEVVIPKLENAMYAAWILIMEQGLSMIKAIAEEKEWEIDMKEVVRIWQGGCIIRAKMLQEVHKHLKKGGIIESKWAEKNIESAYEDWKDIMIESMNIGVPTYVLSSGFASLINDVSAQTSANMIQAMRDYFGAHRYERKDKNSGTFHNDWYDQK